MEVGWWLSKCVIAMTNRGIVQDDIDDDPHRGGRLFKILGNRDDVILIWSLSNKIRVFISKQLCRTHPDIFWNTVVVKTSFVFNFKEMFS